MTIIEPLVSKAYKACGCEKQSCHNMTIIEPLVSKAYKACGCGFSHRLQNQEKGEITIIYVPTNSQVIYIFIYHPCVCVE
jgi:hypothetical protein